MRIVHVVPSLDPADGGPPVVAERLGAAQAMAGADVAIMFRHRPGATARIADALREVPGADRLRLIEVKGRPARGLVDRAAAAAIQREIAAGLDVAHIHGIWQSALAGAAEACRRAQAPYVIAPHGMLDPWSLSQHSFRKRVALALLWRRLLREAAFVHALNRDEADLMPRGMAPAKIIPNGIFIEEFEALPEPGSFRRSHPELEAGPYILFLGRLHYKKGLDLLGPAFARARNIVPNAQLVVAGPDDGARAPFERQIAALGLAAQTHIVGPIYGAQKLAALRDAACFCLPSRQEGFSIAITEALACGLPCVVSAACHFPEVEETGAGRITSLEPSEIGDALGAILQDSQGAAAMGAGGAKLVRERFTWPLIAEQSINAYNGARMG